jgi:peptide/nickel transport system substrate-binding protein
MQSAMSRRALLSIMVAGAGSAVVAACGGAVSAPSPSATAVTNATLPTAPAAQPKPGGTLRTGILGDLPGLDGHLQLQTNSQSVAFAYDTLVGYDDKLTPLPILAESWDVSSDLKTIKLNLRKGVQYHDGREFTSDDVKWNLLRVRDPKLAGVAGFFANQSNWFTSIETPDKNTVVLTSDQPRVGAFDFLFAFNMLDKNTMEGPDAKTRVNGTGPFVFQEWVQGDHVGLTKNKSYWRSGIPYLDGMHVGIFKDSQSMMASLEAGAIDVADAPPIPDIVRLKSNSSYQTIVTTSAGTYYVIIANVQVAPTSNKLFRQGINYAINRKRFTDTVLKGLVGAPQDLPYPPQAPAFDATRNERYIFDLDKARSLIAQSGVTNTDLEIVFSNTSFGVENTQMTQILASDLATIGVNLTLRPVDFATQFDTAVKRTYNGLLMSAGSNANLTDSTTPLISNKFWNPDVSQNFTGLDDPEYARLVAAAASEPDAARRKQLYGQIEDTILDQSAVMVLSLFPRAAMARSNVQGLTLVPRTSYPTVWLG